MPLISSRLYPVISTKSSLTKTEAEGRQRKKPNGRNDVIEPQQTGRARQRRHSSGENKKGNGDEEQRPDHKQRRQRGGDPSHYCCQQRASFSNVSNRHPIFRAAIRLHRLTIASPCLAFAEMLKKLCGLTRPASDGTPAFKIPPPKAKSSSPESINPGPKNDSIRYTLRD